ncbi:MAG: polyprenol monophosphomannose synthase [Candidatus Blackburnbacteria bacterium]|nr:polyprenol monophosphomannose synthase [Candidatus Blackburnbacteria bacterium]
MNAVVVIPTFNERDNISHLLSQLRKVVGEVRGWKIEILVVDDNSPDETGDVVRQFAKRGKNIYLLPRQRKEGLGTAYLAGMRKAYDEMGAEVVLTMDADLSHSPEYLPDLLRKIKEGADFVVGSRYITGGAIPPNWPIQRKLLSVFGNIIVTVFLGSRALSDWTSGYRAIKKSVYERVRQMIVEDRASARGYTFNISFAYHAVAEGFKVSETPIKFSDRRKGKSKLGLEYLFHTPIFLFRTLGSRVHARLQILLGGKVKA